MDVAKKIYTKASFKITFNYVWEKRNELKKEILNLLLEFKENTRLDRLENRTISSSISPADKKKFQIKKQLYSKYETNSVVIGHFVKSFEKFQLITSKSFHLDKKVFKKFKSKITKNSKSKKG